MPNFNFENAALQLQFILGVDEQGKTIKKKQTIQNIAPTATASDLNAFAQAYATLYDGELFAMQLSTTNTIV